MNERHKKLLDTAAQTAAILFVPFCTLYFELLFSLILKYRLTLYDIGFSISTAALLSAVSFAFKSKRIHFVLQGIFTCLLTVVYVSQFLYFRIFQTLYIVQSIGGAKKALSFADILLEKIKENAFLVLLFLVPIILFFSLQRIFLKKLNYSIKFPLISLAAFLVVGAVTTGAVLYDKGGALSPRYLYLSSFVQDKALNQFGLLTMMTLDVKYNVLNLHTDEDEAVDIGGIKIVEPVSAAAGSETTAIVLEPSASATEASSAGTSETTLSPTPAPVVYGPNVMDISFDLAATDGKLLQMNQYFSQKEPTLQNEYTGMFKGKNLILLTCEGFSKYVIDPELTPTLYKMSTEGFVFNNFFTPVWGVSTSDGEYVATTGLIPKAGVWSYTKIADNYMPFAFGNQFAALGYTTKAYHDHTYTYYNRDQSYPAMGYDYKGVGNGLDVKVTWPESDLEMMQLTVPEYVNLAPFHIYYMTVSGHLQYNFGGNFISKKNKDLVADLPYSDHVKAYLACQIELDKALENLIAQLDASGQLENTVIAFSADHYPYGLTTDEFNELAGHDLESTFEMYKNDFILWSADMKEPVVVDKYCSSLDIAPTLSNLFGLEYDSRLYVGTDILSTKSPVVCFQDRSFITDKIMYDANSQEVYKLTNEEITPEYIKSCIQSVNDEFKYSALIIDQNYYRYLFPASAALS